MDSSAYGRTWDSLNRIMTQNLGNNEPKVEAWWNNRDLPFISGTTPREVMFFGSLHPDRLMALQRYLKAKVVSDPSAVEFLTTYANSLSEDIAS